MSNKLSLNISTHSKLANPIKELRAGRFDIEKSLLKDKQKKPESRSKTECFGINETVIDSFLQSEKVFTVDLDAYRQATETYMVAKMSNFSRNSRNST